MTQPGSDNARTDDPEGLRNRAAGFAAAGRDAEAEGLLRQAIARAPDFALAYADLASLLSRLDRADDAMALLDGVLARQPRTIWALSIKAAVLGGERRDEEALALHDALVALAPDVPVPWLNRGHALTVLGRVDEAAATYRQALRLDPANGFAWRGLVDLAVSITAEDIAAMERALQGGKGGPEQILLHFALGKGLGDHGFFERSFRHYETANRLRGLVRPYDPSAVTRMVAETERVCSPAFFRERAGDVAQGANVIFVVGMPRSGSTLVEQILASHSRVEGLGELFELPNIVSRLLNGAPVAALPDRIAALNTGERQELGARYLASVGRYRRTVRPFVTDKMPSNWQHIGLIRLILPEARIIDVRREPLACCWSNFTTYFNGQTTVPTTLQEIGRHYREYVRFLASTEAALPGRLHRVEYEALVGDFAASVRRLLDYLGLPFEDGCLRFNETPRAIHTPSAQQVRQPINRRGLRRWQDYEPWLEALKRELAS